MASKLTIRQCQKCFCLIQWPSTFKHKYTHTFCSLYLRCTFLLLVPVSQSKMNFSWVTPLIGDLPWLTLLTYPDNCLIVGGSARFNKVGFWTIDQSQWRSALVSEQRERRTSLCEEQKKQILHKYEKETHNNWKKKKKSVHWRLPVGEEIPGDITGSVKVWSGITPWMNFMQTDCIYFNYHLIPSDNERFRIKIQNDKHKKPHYAGWGLFNVPTPYVPH